MSFELNDRLYLERIRRRVMRLERKCLLLAKRIKSLAGKETPHSSWKCSTTWPREQAFWWEAYISNWSFLGWSHFLVSPTLLLTCKHTVTNSFILTMPLLPWWTVFPETVSQEKPFLQEVASYQRFNHSNKKKHLTHQGISSQATVFFLVDPLTCLTNHSYPL